MRRDQLPLVTLNGRHTGEQLAHPCPCDQPRCRTLGQHIFSATLDMAPGPRAQSFEPTSRQITIIDSDPPADPTKTVHGEFVAAVQAYWDSARDLSRLIERLRPDRWTPLPEPASDNDWCRNHLETIGVCEPRFRGDLCRGCYDTYRAYGHEPDAQLMQARESRGFYRQRDFIEWKTRLPKPGKRKRKAS